MEIFWTGTSTHTYVHHQFTWTLLQKKYIDIFTRMSLLISLLFPIFLDSAFTQDILFSFDNRIFLWQFYTEASRMKKKRWMKLCIILHLIHNNLQFFTDVWQLTQYYCIILYLVNEFQVWVTEWRHSDSFWTKYLTAVTAGDTDLTSSML